MIPCMQEIDQVFRNYLLSQKSLSSNDAHFTFQFQNWNFHFKNIYEIHLDNANEE